MGITITQLYYFIILCFSPVTLYVPAKHLKQPPSQFVGYKERNPKTYKGFVVLQSDRNPTGEVYCDRRIC